MTILWVYAAVIMTVSGSIKSCCTPSAVLLNDLSAFQTLYLSWRQTVAYLGVGKYSSIQKKEMIITHERNKLGNTEIFCHSKG